MLTVVTPFSRKENLSFLEKVIKDKCHWIVLQADDEPAIDFPEWIEVRRFSVSNKNNISNRLFNEFIASGVDDDMQYMLLNDDDSVEEGFFDKIPNMPVVCVSMKRNDTPAKHIVWDNWKKKECHWEDGVDVLIAHPDNMRIARVAGEQLIVKGYVLKNYRYGLADSSADVPGDAKFVMNVLHEYEPVYIPDAYVLFNYFQDGRFKSFHRKPQVLFIGDYYCAGLQQMGISEWETNLHKSLESTGLVDVATFHYDKYYYHYGKRGDEPLIKWVEEHRPDYIILVLYKPLGADPTVINQATLDAISNTGTSKLISIWGDLEAEEQRTLAKSVEKYMWKSIGTANKEVVESLGYIYMHVPKDPRHFNNPNKERDIEVLFNGSFGHGREERREVLQYLLDNGVKLIACGSEGLDHFTTEEYADLYKRAKIAISFSKARGMDVVNARVFEAMLCGSMLLNQESPELDKLYIKDNDFVEWKDKEDLLKKVWYYLENAKERETIADNGCNKTQEIYSAQIFWEKILQKNAY